MKASLLLCMIAVTLVTSSCHSFHRQWQEATNLPAPQDFTGPWEGQWVSTASGHKGKLRCLVTPSDEDQVTYHFHYWARWGLLSGAFATTYPVQRVSANRWSFAGDSDLGALGGVYRHTGQATPTAFQATYTASRGDHGQMRMHRPKN